tara:strand:- start:5070 stop:5777 length:708 start_codon:yes stop_codon:yes gene_type:complete
MLEKELIQKLFHSGKERELLFFVYLYAHAYDGWRISSVEIQSRFGIPKTTLNRIMEQKWNGNGTEMEWKWSKSALCFSKLGGKSGTEMERKWNGNGMVSGQKEVKKKSVSVKENPNTLVSDVISHLNRVTGKKFRAGNQTSISLINKRESEGFVLNDFCKVIDSKSEEWLNTDSDKYLRPQTLFGNKFEGYVNQRKVQKTNEELKFHAKISRNDKYEAAAERAREIDYGTITDIG